MGKGADGGGTRRARRHTGSIAAAAAGATALATAAAVAGWQRRRRERTIAPEDSLAGPPASPRVEPAPDAPVPTAAPEPTALLHHDPEPAARPPAASLLPTITIGDPPTPTPAAAAVSPPPPVDRDADPAPVESDPAPGRDPDPAPTAGPAVPAAPAVATPARRRVPRGVAVLVGVALVLVLGLGAVVLAGGGPGDAEAADPRPAGETGGATRSTTTTTAPVSATDAFAVASRRLTDAGSFSYTGTADATDVSAARPMLWLAVATTVEGEVDTQTARLREVSVAADGSATETVAARSEVWGRRAASVDVLAGLPLEGLPGLSGSDPAGRGAALLPSWLAAAVAPSELGPDEQGRRTFQATIPAATMGVVEREVDPVDALVTLTLDAAGDPVRVEIVSSPDGPRFHLVFEIGSLGNPVAIAIPTGTAPEG